MGNETFGFLVNSVCNVGFLQVILVIITDHGSLAYGHVQTHSKAGKASWVFP